MSHYEKLNVLSDSQHGFRKRRSCESQLIITIDQLAKNTASGNQVDIILIDFEKAFDKVPHSRLLYKLQFYGIRGRTNAWIKSFLSNRKQQVVLEGTKSDKDDVLSGVPQVTVLGPLLFLTYINDMPSHTESDVRLFADDSLLYREIRNTNDSIQLQEDLNALESWEKKWLMRFSPSKCNVISIPPKNKAVIELHYTLHGQVLEQVDNAKYLGVTISNNLSWNKHIDNITAKGNRTLGFVRRNLKNCSRLVKTAGYTVLVRPGIEYASTVWDPTTQTSINSLELIQRRAARFVNNDYKTRTPGCVTKMLDDLGWDFLQSRRKDNRLAMLYRIQNDLVDINRTQYLTGGDSRTRGAHKFYQQRITHNVYNNSFFPRTIRDWNTLPATVADMGSLKDFRLRLQATH